MNDNLIAQYQFACALALREELNINESIEIFDPSMGKVLLSDCILSHRKIQPLPLSWVVRSFLIMKKQRELLSERPYSTCLIVVMTCTLPYSTLP